MLNWVWAGMIALSVVFGLCTGNMGGVTDGILQGASQGVELSITLLGGMMLWSGMTEIMKASGLTDLVGKGLSPVIALLFPSLKYEPAAKNAIALNMSANLLGLGNAATPLGLHAMKELQSINRHPKRASNSMVTFVVLNSVSIQLIPTSVAVLRGEYGSQSPMGILLPVWFASLVTAVVALLLTRMLSSKECCL